MSKTSTVFLQRLNMTALSQAAARHLVRRAT